MKSHRIAFVRILLASWVVCTWCASGTDALAAGARQGAASRQQPPRLVLLDDTAELDAALAARTPARGIGVRVAGFGLPDADPSKVRLLILGEVAGRDAGATQGGSEPGKTPAAPLVSVAYLIEDEGGQVSTRAQRRLELRATTGGLGFSEIVTVPAGKCRLKLAAMRNNKVGSAEVDLDLRLQSAGGLRVGDLIVGETAGGELASILAIDRKIGGDRLVVSLAFVGDASPSSSPVITIEVARDPAGPALMSAPAITRPGGDGIDLAQAMLDLRELPAGDYVARAFLSQGGGEPLRRETRFTRQPIVPPAVSAPAPGVPGGTRPAAVSGPVTEIRLPGGVERLLRAAGVAGQADPTIALPAFIRAVHVLPAKPRTDLAQILSGSSPLQPAEDDIVPLPLTANWWLSAVFEGRVPPGALAGAILGDRRAAFIYLGLMSLDDDTLAYFAGRPAAMQAMSGRAAGAFAQWGRSIRIDGGRVQVPGGDAVAAAWQAVVGEPVTDPDRFVKALLSRDGGRLAYFFDTVAHLDRRRQSFALSAGRAGDRTDRVKALYASFAATRTILSDGDWPAVRHPFGPAAILRQVEVDADGRMTAPAAEALWEAAMSADAAGCAKVTGGGPVDAAWLADRIERQVLESRGDWVAAVAFAQRAFRAANATEMAAACEAINAFPRYDALLLTLERLGFRRPGDYVTMLRYANRLWAGADRNAAVFRTAQVQGILQVLALAAQAGTLTADQARELTLSLASTVDPAVPGAAGTWLRGTLLPRACAGEPSADGCMVRLVSGAGQPAAGGRVIEWEDERYRMDPGAAVAARLQRVRVVQRATGFDAAVNVMEAAAIAAQRHAADDIERAATIVKAVAPGMTASATLFGHAVPPVRALLDRALEGLAPSATDGVRTAATAALEQAADLLLADALVSFAYAVAIGDPDAAVLMGGNPATGHLFDGTLGPATEAWHLPEEVQALDRSWLVEGSVLMLRTIYPKSWLRRLSIHDPGTAIRADPQDVRVFGETVTAFDPLDLTDEGRDEIVAAIRRGRSRLSGLMGSPNAFWKTAREVGLGEWRCRAALWAAARQPDAGNEGAPAVTRYFSLAELMWLGQPAAPLSAIDAWGVATRPIDGGASVRMPRASTWEDYQGPRGVGQLPTQMADVHLAVAEALADLKLPAALAPDVAAQAVWDVMAAARMAHRDDWFALVRASQSIPRDRFLDYVSALTATGPLVPVK